MSSVGRSATVARVARSDHTIHYSHLQLVAYDGRGRTADRTLAWFSARSCGWSWPSRRSIAGRGG